MRCLSLLKDAEEKVRKIRETINKAEKYIDEANIIYLVENIKQLKYPKEEKYRLISQIRRSAVSIPSNIAEGYGRKITADYLRLLYVAYGSVCELETQFLLSGD